MTLDALIMLAGAFVAALPFLGFPNSWDNVLFFLAGIFVIALGIVVRRRRGASSSGSAHVKTSAPGSRVVQLEESSGIFDDNSPRG